MSRSLGRQLSRSISEFGQSVKIEKIILPWVCVFVFVCLCLSSNPIWNEIQRGIREKIETKTSSRVRVIFWSQILMKICLNFHPAKTHFNNFHFVTRKCSPIFGWQHRILLSNNLKWIKLYRSSEWRRNGGREVWGNRIEALFMRTISRLKNISINEHNHFRIDTRCFCHRVAVTPKRHFHLTTDDSGAHWIRLFCVILN